MSISLQPVPSKQHDADIGNNEVPGSRDRRVGKQLANCYHHDEGGNGAKVQQHPQRKGIYPTKNMRAMAANATLYFPYHNPAGTRL